MKMKITKVRLLKTKFTLYFEDWVSDMKRTDKQKVTMIVYDNYIQRFGLTKTGAAKETGLLFRVNEKVEKRFSEQQWRIY